MPSTEALQEQIDANPTVVALLFAKSWFGFDLDDTLHEFRKASAHASQSVFEKILKSRHPSLKDRERIHRWENVRRLPQGAVSYLLEAYGLKPSTELLSQLLLTYRSSLRAALTLKPGARQLLERLKALGKKVIVVTEGPKDAQEWTVAELSLEPLIDILVTTNEVGMSKVDGLFPAVLHKYNIAPGDMVYVGDNAQRDVVPARAAGIDTVLYNEKGDLFNDPHHLKVNSLSKLEHLLSC
ncbi:HAD-like domain-containing protein [Aspergillus multicolor]|uniref:HAD family hydrolase n=1 Tax=Aspergillus multicolor TaxID=41759 RepID=UPI003CCCDAD6